VRRLVVAVAPLRLIVVAVLVAAAGALIRRFPTEVNQA